MKRLITLNIMALGLLFGNQSIFGMEKKQKHNINLMITNSTGNPINLIDYYKKGVDLPKSSYKVIKDGENIKISLPENFTGSYQRDFSTKDGLYEIYIDYHGAADIASGISNVVSDVSELATRYDKNAKESNYFIEIDLKKDLKKSEIDFNLLQS